jgi:hypothetical protein
VCPEEAEERFFINSTIGLQDNLAKTHLNNIYSTLAFSVNDTMIFQRMYGVMEYYNKDTHLFNNTNDLFTEDKFLANRSYIAKKGTAAAMKYIGRATNDAQIQGKDNIYGNYFMNVITEKPFQYHVESTVLNIVFERFIKPLAHPIGMGYRYSNVCTDPTGNMTEHPLLEYDYADLTLSVQCMCYTVGQEDVPVPTDPENIDCVYNQRPDDYPAERVFATPTGEGLWEPIKDHGNITWKQTEGYVSNPTSEYYGQNYTKYTFKNAFDPTVSQHNYLIKYQSVPKVNDTSIRINIFYYYWDSNAREYILGAKFINPRHCNVKYSDDPKRKSIVDDDFYGSCNDTYNGIFQFLDDGETTPPNSPAPSGFYEGYLSGIDSQGIVNYIGCEEIKYCDEEIGCNKYTSTQWGGVFERWDDLYFGWFRFLDKGRSLY